MFEGYLMVKAFKGKPIFHVSACDHCCALMSECTAHIYSIRLSNLSSPISAKPFQQSREC